MDYYITFNIGNSSVLNTAVIAVKSDRHIVLSVN